MLFSSVYCFHLLVIFYIFLLQATDSEIDLASDKSIDIDLDEIMCDADIGSSLDPIKMIEKSLKKNRDIICLLFIQP